jgi:hypothetical protein
MSGTTEVTFGVRQSTFDHGCVKTRNPANGEESYFRVRGSAVQYATLTLSISEEMQDP